MKISGCGRSLYSGTRSEGGKGQPRGNKRKRGALTKMPEKVPPAEIDGRMILPASSQRESPLFISGK
jgi:hypothetical protein